MSIYNSSQENILRRLLNNAEIGFNETHSLIEQLQPEEAGKLIALSQIRSTHFALMGLLKTSLGR